MVVAVAVVADVGESKALMTSIKTRISERACLYGTHTHTHMHMCMNEDENCFI